MTAYQWLLLDADNTLFDFDAAEEFALGRLFCHYGLADTPELRAGYRAINSALWAAFDRGEIDQEELVLERFRRFFAQLGITGNPQEWNQFYLNALADCPALLPGAEGLCRRLAQRYTLALVTNGVAFVQRRRLRASPLAPLFGDRVFISGEMGCRKPEPFFYEKVLSALGAGGCRERVLAVGDSLSSDIQGACNAGLDSLWLHTGAPAGAIRPTYQAQSLEQMETLLLP